jgi:hypothetical protein
MDNSNKVGGRIPRKVFRSNPNAVISYHNNPIPRIGEELTSSEDAEDC